MEDEAASAKWFFATGGAVEDSFQLPPDALAAAPPEVAHGGELLPRGAVEGRCRLCGTVEALTREHVPPASAGNAGNAISIDVSDWLQRQTLDELPPGRTEQGGTFGRTLCRDCNTRTGLLYAREYTRWAGRAARLFVEEMPPVEELDLREALPAYVIRFDEVRPGAFARQVLSLMASISGPWDLTGQHPDLRAVVLDGEPGQLPDGMTLGMCLYAGPHQLIAGPSLHVDRDTGAWRWMLALAFPPLGFEMTLAASAEQATPMCEIGNFLGVSTDATTTVELDVIVGFGHSGLPGDWRNRRQLEDRLTIDGLPDIADAPSA